MNVDESDESPDAILSFQRDDPERMVGLPAGRFTNPHHVTMLIGAMLITTGIYFLFVKFPNNVVSQSFTQRGIVPGPILFLSIWGLLILGVKYLKLRFQRRALDVKISPDDPTFKVSPATVNGLIDRIDVLIDKPSDFVLFNRIRMALANLRNMRQIGDVRATLDSQAETDEAMFDSGYSILRGIIWAVPVLGFIGTVLGLSQAIGAFSGVLSASAEIDQLKPALQQVTTGLGVAFETTLQGLVAALLLHMLLTFLKRAEEDFLDRCKEYCQIRIVSRLRLIEEEN
jgi:biopolymer transport protein ExbB/TolQ